MKPVLWDVAVAGGGPAGCSAAISLAQRGLRVVLFESKTYPNDKLCGEFLSPECADTLCALGLEKRLTELEPPLIQMVSLTAPDGNAWETRLPGSALGLSRKTLDAALADRAQQAGVVVREAETVRWITGNLEDGFELETVGRTNSHNEVARTVVAAHGKRSALDRSLGRRFLEQRQPYVALKAHFRGPPIPGRIELHAFPGGYCGMSEIEGREKVVCLLVQEQVFQEVGGRGPGGVERFIEWMKTQNLYLRSWLQWADRIHEHWISVAQVPFLKKTQVEGDVMMAGDSAGLIAPLAGNGIAMALEGGMLAADCLARYIDGEIGAKELRRLYPSAWRRKFGARLSVGRILQRLLMHSRSASLALRLLDVVPSAGRYLVAHTRSPIEQREKMNVFEEKGENL